MTERTVVGATQLRQCDLRETHSLPLWQFVAAQVDAVRAICMKSRARCTDDVNASTGLRFAEPSKMKTVVLLSLFLFSSQVARAETYDLEPVETAVPKWRLALRANYFRPSLAPADRGPFFRSFGDLGGLMTGFDVERRIVYSTRFGTLTGGGSIDVQYLREDSRNKRDTFRLIPVTAMMGWHATQLADELQIPIVPYLKVGAGYSRWTSLDYERELFGRDRRMHHGSQWHADAAVGISLRAADIDRDSARSMRESGILHSGFFVELRTITGKFGGSVIGVGIEFEF